MGNRFREDRPYEIAVGLDPTHLHLLTKPDIKDILDAAAHIVASGPGDPLVQTESWRGISVVQEIIARVKGGFRMKD